MSINIIKGLDVPPNCVSEDLPEGSNLLEPVMVIWEDIKSLSSGGQWMMNSEVDEAEIQPLLVCSSGFIVKQTDQHIWISESISSDFIGNPFQVPTGVIRKIIKLNIAPEDTGWPPLDNF